MARQERGRFGTPDIRTPRRTKLYVHERNLSSDLAPIFLSEGESPFGPPPLVYELEKDPEFVKKVLESTFHYKEMDMSPVSKYIKERFKLKGDSYMEFSGGGSDSLIDKLMLLAHDDNARTQVWGIAPHFPGLNRAINYFRNMDELGEIQREARLMYSPIQHSFLSPTEEILGKAKVVRAEDEREYMDDTNNISHVIYLCNPGTPRGEVIKPEAIKSFISTMRRYKTWIIVDEAFGDVLPDEESAIPLTERYPNVVVLRSFSKIIGLPGLRFGYMVASREIGERVENLKRNYDISGPQAVIANTLAESGTLSDHIQNVREQIIDTKSDLIAKIQKAGIQVAPTDMRTPILSVVSPNNIANLAGALAKIGVDATAGEAFPGEYEDVDGFQSVRITIHPDKNMNDEIVKRIKIAITA